MVNDMHKHKLLKAYYRYQAGEISQKAYNKIERKIVQELKALNRIRYGYAMQRGTKV